MSPGAVSRMALPLLETSLEANPADGLAWQAKGTALWLLGRREESWPPSGPPEGSLPTAKETLVAAGTRAAQMGSVRRHSGTSERAIAINPWRRTITRWSR